METVNYFKAFSDDTRLRLVNLFLHHELNVNEIVVILNMGQSRISRHLKILSDSGLITFRRNGNWTFYSAVTDGEGFNFIRSIKYVFQRDRIFSKDLLEARSVIEERSKEIIRFFDSIAEDWEELKQEIIGNFNLNNLILKFINNSNIIVDLGCGTGDLLPLLKTKADIVIGVDKSPKMLEQTRGRFSQNDKGIDLRIGEIEHLPLRDEEADLAVINMVLHHLQSPFTAFQEIYRVLKKRGSFIIIDFCSHSLESMRGKYGDRWLGFSEKEIVVWLRNTGFGVKKIEYFSLKKELKGFIIKSIKVNIKNEIKFKEK